MVLRVLTIAWFVVVVAPVRLCSAVRPLESQTVWGWLAGPWLTVTVTDDVVYVL